MNRTEEQDLESRLEIFSSKIYAQNTRRAINDLARELERQAETLRVFAANIEFEIEKDGFQGFQETPFGENVSTLIFSAINNSNLVAKQQSAIYNAYTASQPR